MEALTTEEAYAFMQKALVAHIGVIADGAPYVTPMSFVLEENRILFRTKPGQRFEALVANPRVCIEASRYDEESGDWVSVIVSGDAAVVEDDETRQLTVQLLLRKYEDVLGSPLSRGGLQPMAGFPHVVQVDIEEISGLSSGRGVGARTRPGRL